MSANDKDLLLVTLEKRFYGPARTLRWRLHIYAERDGQMDFAYEASSKSVDDALEQLDQRRKGVIVV